MTTDTTRKAYAMILQAIVTKYLPPSNTRGSRIKATAWAGSITVPLDYSKTTEEAHAAAAEALARKLEWKGVYFGGGMPDGTGNCYVNCGATCKDDAFTI